MKITILTDNKNSWIIPYVNQLKKEIKNHEIKHIFNHSDIDFGDIMFILGCEKIVKPDKLKFHKNNIVIHPSKLPEGRGWSPLTWQVLEGKNEIPVSLFEANEKIDDGEVYFIDYIKLTGKELNNEIKHKQGLITKKMVKHFIKNYNKLQPVSQIGNPTYYQKRTTKNSELDINKTIMEQFNLLRVVDNKRYPAYFIVDDQKYFIKIFK